MPSKTTQTSQSTTQPWSVQIPYLEQAFQGALNAYNKADTAQAPTQFTAQFTPQQLSSFQQMLNYGSNNSFIPNSSANAGVRMAGAGSSAAQGALGDLAGYKPQGGTASNINAANSYVAGQNIPGMVNADMQMARQQANESVLPSIAREAAGGGNVNSSRMAIQQGLVQQGLAQQAAGDAARLQGQTYNSGLGLAEQNSEAGNNNMLSAILGRLSGGVNTANAGVGANSASIAQQGGLFNLANLGIAGQNMASQAALTNRQQQYQSAVNSPFDALRNFYGIIGANNWGSQSSGTSTSSTNNPWGTIASLMGSFGSFF